MPIRRQAPWAQRLYFRKKDQTPLDVTNIPLRMQFREKPSSPTPLVDMTTANGKIVTTADPTNGVVDLILSEADTAAFPVQTLFWDIRRSDTGAWLCGGRALVDQVVTRD